MDYEVSRKVWESQIPVQFTLQSDGPHGDPLPYYTMLPRFSYLALVLPKVLNSFNRRDDGGQALGDKVWLESNGVPLKMYVPVGVIYDQANLFENDSILEISVRTSVPPSEYHQVDREMMEAMFMQNVKEADYLKTKAETTKNMMKEEYSQLWRSISNNNFDEFWTMIQKLMETRDNNDFAHVPLRVYLKKQQCKPILLTPKHQDGSLRTVGDAVAEMLKSSDPFTCTDDLRLISHGIDLPHHTPLVFAAKNLSYPDNFVHIVVAS